MLTTNTFFREKPISLIVSIFENPDFSITDHSKLTDMTYSHAHDLIKSFKNQGLVTLKKEGRSRYSLVTASGKKLYDLILKFQSI